MVGQAAARIKRAVVAAAHPHRHTTLPGNLPARPTGKLAKCMCRMQNPL
jgi:hypothetical protein